MTSTTASSDNITPAVQQVRDSIRKVLDDSGRSFKEGMVALKANKRSESGQAFDKSVETFLFSTLDIQRDASLQGCYGQLIETIYRLEFPTGNPIMVGAQSRQAIDDTTATVADFVGSGSPEGVVTASVGSTY
ncbi:MAG: hypothetical protein AAB288_00540, partial [Acidobacteriota bacterium]